MRVGRVPSVSATRYLAAGQGRLRPSLHPQRFSPLHILLVPGKSLFSRVDSLSLSLGTENLRV